FCKNARPRSLNVEACQPKAATHQIHEREEPGETVKSTSLLQCCAITPHVCQDCRRQAEGDDICDGIELYANLGGSFCHARDAAIEHVKQKRPTDCLGSV